MRTVALPALAFALALTLTAAAAGQDARPSVVAAENFYGDVAGQIGGDRIELASILSNPNQDPHLFETTPSIVRQIAAARIVIYNGANYDAWMDKLIKAVPRPERTVVSVAELVGKKAGDNPHLWYEPGAMPMVARALADAFSRNDPAHAEDYAGRCQAFIASLAPVNRKIAEIRAKHAGVAITATEPVYGYMASALGLNMRNERFQLAIMNDTEPSARDIAAFKRDLQERKVKVLLYNKQASTRLAQQMLDVARQSNVAVVGVTETKPAGLSYQDWMLMQLEELQKALAQPST
jgi:zinc/manganese transport system substrate-binding protein